MAGAQFHHLLLRSKWILSRNLESGPEAGLQTRHPREWEHLTTTANARPEENKGSTVSKTILHPAWLLFEQQSKVHPAPTSGCQATKQPMHRRTWDCANPASGMYLLYVLYFPVSSCWIPMCCAHMIFVLLGLACFSEHNGFQMGPLCSR